MGEFKLERAYNRMRYHHIDACGRGPSWSGRVDLALHSLRRVVAQSDTGR